MSVRLLTVPRCFGSQPFSLDSPPLRPTTDVSDGDRERDHRDYGYGDNENRGHVRRLPGAIHANRFGRTHRVRRRVFDTCKWVSAWPMGVVFSIFLIAVGAILRYATSFDVRSVDVDEVGLILMIVGAVGFVLSLLYEVFWARERSRWYRYAGRGRDVPPGPDEPRY